MSLLDKYLTENYFVYLFDELEFNMFVINILTFSSDDFSIV